MLSKTKIPMYIAAQLENSKTCDRVWLTLPVSKDRFAAALAKISVTRGEFVVSDYAVKVPKLSQRMLKQTPLAAVNYLAARLNTLTDDAIIKLCAICDTDYYFDYIGQYIDYTYSPGDYTLLPGITDAEALGEYYLGGNRRIIADARLNKCVDRREYGKNLAAVENGVFSPLGYITSKSNWSYKFKDRAVPEHLNLKGFIGEDIYADWEEDNDYGKPTYPATSGA